MKERIFYVTANGEPLGIMTMKDAFAWSFGHGHVVLVMEELKR